MSLYLFVSLYLSLSPYLLCSWRFFTCALLPVCVPNAFYLSVPPYLSVSRVLSTCICPRTCLCPPCFLPICVLVPVCVPCTFYLSVSSYLSLSLVPFTCLCPRTCLCPPCFLPVCVLVPVCAPCVFYLSASSYLSVPPVFSTCLCPRTCLCPPCFLPVCVLVTISVPCTFYLSVPSYNDVSPGALYPSCVPCAFHPVSVFIAGAFHLSVSLVLCACRAPPAFSAVSCIPMCFLPVRVLVPVCVLGALHLSCVPVLSPCLMFAVLSTCLMSLVLLPVLRPMCFLPVCVLVPVCAPCVFYLSASSYLAVSPVVMVGPPAGVFCRLSACASRPFCLSLQYQALNFHLCVSGPVLPTFLCAHALLNLVACTYLFSWPFIIICVYGTFLSVHKVIFTCQCSQSFLTASFPIPFTLLCLWCKLSTCLSVVRYTRLRLWYLIAICF